MASRDFQERALSYLVQDPDGLALVGDKIRPEYFDEGVNRLMFSLVQAVWKRTNQVPTVNELLGLIQRALRDQKKGLVVKLMLDKARKILGQTLSCTNDELFQFLVHQELRLISLDTASVSFTDAGEKYHETMTRLDSLRTLTNGRVRSEVLDPFTDLLLDNDELEMDEEYQGAAIKTGWSRLDAIRRGGGIWRGELVVFAAATGVGKTMVMTDLAMNVVEQGHRVLYLSLDNLMREMHERILARVTKISLDDVKTQKDLNTAAKAWRLKYSVKPNQFMIHDMIPRKTGKGDLLRAISTTEKKFGKVDMVVVDYMSLLNKNPKLQGWEAEAEVAEDMRGIAKEMSVAMVSASQGNKESLRESVVTLHALAGYFGKTFPAGLAITVNQSDAEAQMQPPQCRLAIAKNTRGKKHLVLPMYCDLSMVHFWENLGAQVLDIDTVKGMMNGNGNTKPRSKRPGHDVDKEASNRLKFIKHTRQVEVEEDNG